MVGEVTDAIMSFFVSGKLLREVNSTIIALIPKVPNPYLLNDYRPISCCNIIYKCISKILATRIKGVLLELIDKSQTAFIQGRRIFDNVLISQELLRNYHLDRGSPRCTLKIDFMKAFDNVK